jgi:hypothetical protein
VLELPSEETEKSSKSCKHMYIKPEFLSDRDCRVKTQSA